MNRRLTLIFLILALASGVLAGTPLHAGNMKSQSMKCCKKMKSSDQQQPAASLARLHCAINCTDTSPTPGGSASNFSPPTFTVSESLISQIARLLAREEKTHSPPALRLESVPAPREIPPKYIQHHSFLI